jgi:hypothetical protein
MPMTRTMTRLTLVLQLVAGACAISKLSSKTDGARSRIGGDHDLTEQLHATQLEFEPLTLTM